VSAIRDRGYQPYAGERAPAGTRWRVIAARALASSTRQAWVIVLLVSAALPALVGGVAMYIKAKLAARLSVEPPDAYVFYVAVKPYGTSFIAFLTALTVGSGAIADDRRAGAFAFYFARPVTRDEYLAGKLAATVALVGAAAAGAPLALALLRLALATDGAEAWRLAPLPLYAVGFGALEALALAAPALALSSLTRGRGAAQGGFAALFLLPWIGGAMVARVARSPWPLLLSLPDDLEAVAHALYRVPVEDARALPAWAAAAALAALVAGALWLVRRQLAAVEVA
jgi:ABC-type transport system involved in multi-copper enzyme maturation permease subunit